MKNIAKPVGAYRVVLEPRVTKGKGSGFRVRGSGKEDGRLVGRSTGGDCRWALAGIPATQVGPPTPVVEKADPKKMALPLPELPSIAVLPFVNLSEDPKQQLLCDGITDNIINALSKVPRLFVIARNSTFAYKGKTVKAKLVSEELGVQYVLEGSIQRSGDRVRITAQMVDALTGNQLLSERFDGETADLFNMQDDITFKVLRAVHLQLGGAALSSKYYRGTHGLDCFLKLQEAQGSLQRFTMADTRQAQKLAEEGLAMCPEIPTFYRLLAVVNMNYYWFDLSKSPQGYIEKAEELLQKTLTMDENNPDAYGNLSQLYIMKKDYDKAIAEAEKSLSLDPGSAWGLWRYARVLTAAGKPEEAIPLQEKAIRLNPLAPAPFYGDLGLAYRLTGRFEEAIRFYKKAIERAPNDFWFHAHLAAVYIMMGRDEEARAEAAEVLRINPRFSVESYAKTTTLKDRSVVDKSSDAMRKAGLPDKAPGAQP